MIKPKSMKDPMGSKMEKDYQKFKVKFAMDVLAIKKGFLPEDFREVLNKLKEIIPDLGFLIAKYESYSDTQTFDEFIIERSDRPRNGRPWIDSNDYKEFRQRHDDFFKNTSFVDAIKFYCSVPLRDRLLLIAQFLGFPTYLGWDEEPNGVTFYFCERKKCSKGSDGFNRCKESVKDSNGPLCAKYSSSEFIPEYKIKNRFERMRKIER